MFQDSDVAKWLETLSFSLMRRPDPELERCADEVIQLIEKAQAPDGYLNTYFTIKEPGKRWTNLHEAHELYCAGHFIEAAVAYHEATGKSRLLDVMRRYADTEVAACLTSTRRLATLSPRTRTSRSVARNVLIASSGAQTIGSPAALKEVLRRSGTPLRCEKAEINS